MRRRASARCRASAHLHLTLWRCVSPSSATREEGRAQVLRGAAQVQPGAPDAVPLPPVWHHGQRAAGHPLLILHRNHGGKKVDWEPVAPLQSEHSQITRLPIDFLSPSSVAWFPFRLPRGLEWRVFSFIVWIGRPVDHTIESLSRPVTVFLGKRRPWCQGSVVTPTGSCCSTPHCGSGSLRRVKNDREDFSLALIGFVERGHQAAMHWWDKFVHKLCILH